VLDVVFFRATDALGVFVLRFHGLVIADRDAEAVSQQIRNAQNQDHCGGKA